MQAQCRESDYHGVILGSLAYVLYSVLYCRSAVLFKCLIIVQSHRSQTAAVKPMSLHTPLPSMLGNQCKLPHSRLLLSCPACGELFIYCTLCPVHAALALSSSGQLFGLEWTISMCVLCTVCSLCFPAQSAPLHVVFEIIVCGVVSYDHTFFTASLFFQSAFVTSFV